MDFKNTVIIMTSNIGAHHMLDRVTDSGEIHDEARRSVMDEMRRHFRPEFLNRVDDVVLFKALTRDEIGEIVELLIADIRKRLEDRRIELEITDSAREFVARDGFDPVYGARPAQTVPATGTGDENRQRADWRRHLRRRAGPGGRKQRRACPPP